MNPTSTLMPGCWTVLGCRKVYASLAACSVADRVQPITDVSTVVESSCADLQLFVSSTDTTRSVSLAHILGILAAYLFDTTTMGSLKSLNPNAEVMGRNAALFMNINAAKGLHEVMKTNFGPKGTIKMLVSGAGGINAVNKTPTSSSFRHA